MTRAFLMGLPCALLLLGAPPAYAFLQGRVATGCGTRWEASELRPQNADVGRPPAKPGAPVLQLAYTVGHLPPVGLTASQFAAAAHKAFAAWSQVDCALCESPAKGCAPLACPSHALGWTFTGLGPAPPGPYATFCEDARAPGCGNFVQTIQAPALWPFGKGVIAQTAVLSNTVDGTIVDADILLNDVDMHFCVAAGNCADGKQNLQSTLTHEVGHLLGLDHSQVAAARMAPFVGQGPKDPTGLHEDDRTGICTAYRTTCTPGCAGQGCCLPSGLPAPTKPAPDRGCQAGSMASGVPGLLVLVGALLCRLRRKEPDDAP